MILVAKAYLQPLVLGLFLSFIVSGCWQDHPSSVSFAGETMGTVYHIKYLPKKDSPDVTEVKRLTDMLLATLNAKMSTYQADSEISRFNQSTSTKPVVVSPELASVIREAILIGRKSGGALDVTVLPIVELWGFGAKASIEKPPTKMKIQAVLKKIGLEKLVFDEKLGALSKRSPSLSVDLSSIAKGYAVDQVSVLLSFLGLANHLVEIGGELRTGGHKRDQSPWVVGIEEPDAPPGSVKHTLKLSGWSMATSGDYRNYFEDKGVRYSHTINPQTGYPVQHHLASVSVILKSCMSADGWATALDVLGEDKGFELAERQGLMAYFIYRDGDQFKEKATRAFKEFERLANSKGQ